MQSQSYSAQVDVWSLGCIFAELFSREPLFPGLNDFHVFLRIVQTLGTPHFHDCPGYSGASFAYLSHSPKFQHSDFQELREKHSGFGHEEAAFLNKMLQYNPNERFTCIELLEDPYLAEQ